MCQITSPSGTVPVQASAAKSAFSCQRHSPTTFVLQENDRWGENPLIYVKIYLRHLVLIDSGCGGSLQTPNIDVTLQEFLETVPVSDNGGEALNPLGTKAYTIICTHCHYDHVGGIPGFNPAPGLAVWASSLGKPYMTDPNKFWTASLCCYVGMALPEFTVSHWADDGVRITAKYDGSQEDLGLVIYQTPGHMPDQVAIWDPAERFLYVGDTVYEHSPVLFPEGGSFFMYRDTIARLRALVQSWNAATGPTAGRVKIAAGHITKDVDAGSLLEETETFLNRVLASDVMAVDVTDGYPWFGGNPAVEFKNDDGSVHFMGLRKSFENLR